MTEVHRETQGRDECFSHFLSAVYINNLLNNAQAASLFFLLQNACVQNRIFRYSKLVKKAAVHHLDLIKHTPDVEQYLTQSYQSQCTHFFRHCIILCNYLFSVEIGVFPSVK